jgi:1-acyl-sn-glycerol-3-phosphate acyltransferase
MMEGRFPALTPEAPRRPSRGLIRALAALIIAPSDWKVVGELPKVPKLVGIAAPHSSNWDGIFGIAAACWLGLGAQWMGKSQLFRCGLGPLMRALGGIAIDRGNPHGAVGQMAELFRQNEKMWLFIAPEGTRKPVKKWRTGFWHIAEAAKVPIFPVAIDFPSKSFHLGPLIHTTGDQEKDLQTIYAFYHPFRGKGGKRAVPDPGRATVAGGDFRSSSPTSE